MQYFEPIFEPADPMHQSEGDACFEDLARILRLPESKGRLPEFCKWLADEVRVSSYYNPSATAIVEPMLLAGTFPPCLLHHYAQIDLWDEATGLVLLTGFDPSSLLGKSPSNILHSEWSLSEMLWRMSKERLREVLMESMTKHNESTITRLDNLAYYGGSVFKIPWTEERDNLEILRGLDRQYRRAMKRVWYQWVDSELANKDKFRPREIIQWAKENNIPIPWLSYAERYLPRLLSDESTSMPIPITENQAPKDEIDYPPKLDLAIQAYKNFWSNADPDEKDTHPINEKVEDWLMKQDTNLSKHLASSIASIIRPEWASTGRKPDV